MKVTHRLICLYLLRNNGTGLDIRRNESDPGGVMSPSSRIVYICLAEYTKLSSNVDETGSNQKNA